MKRTLKLLDRMERSWDGCTACDLHNQRTRLVHWRGNPAAPLFIIGEAPGADEDSSGLPFVGAAGQLLDAALAKAGIDSGEQTFIANMVACRPPGNRTPEREEIAACAPRLQFMLKTINPRLIVLLGATAARLAGVTSITAHRGEIHNVDVLCYDHEVRDWTALTTFHPSYLLRTGGESGANFANVVKDFRKAWKLANTLAAGPIDR